MRVLIGAINTVASRYQKILGAPEEFALTLGAGAIVMYAPSTGVATYTPEKVLGRLPRLVVETTETGATTLSIRRR